MGGTPNVEFENTLRFINKIMSVCGNNILDENWRKGFKGKLLYLVPTITMLLIPFWNLKAVLYNLHDFVKLLDTFMSCGACLQLTYKLIAIQFVYKDFRCLINNCRDFRIQYAEDISKEEHSDKTITRRTRIVVKAFYFTTGFTCTIMAVSPLFKSRRSFPLHYYLPFTSPFDSPYYEINYIWICYEFLLYLQVAMGIDSIFLLLVSEMCLQFNIIKYALTGLKHGNNCEENLRKVLQMYQNLSQNIKIVNDTFYNIFMIQFFTSFLMICSSLFMTINTGNYDLAAYVAAFILQLGIYCVYGELLKQKLQNFLFDLYNNEWYDMQLKEKKSLMIMMSYAQVDLTLKAGGLIELSLATYLQVLKTAYTYCAVMRDIEI